MIPSATTQQTRPKDAFNIYHSTCLKGVAVIMLIFHHCFLRPDRYEGQTLTFIIPEHWINYVALFFKICVCIFTFISAYGITLKMMSQPCSDSKKLPYILKNTITSRLCKLLGGFILVFLLIQVFALFHDPGRFTQVYGADRSDAIQYFLVDMLGLAQLLKTPTYLGTFWYYSLAIVVVILVPFMYLMCKKVGGTAFLAFVAVINFTVSFPNNNIWHYILCTAVGVACAQGDVLNRLVAFRLCKKNPTWNHILKCVLELLALFLLMIIREGPLKLKLYPFWDAVIPVALAWFCCEFFFFIPGIRQILWFLGKHSLNIFLVHNFIRNIWFYDFTYSFRYPVLIAAVLLCISLAISVIIELFKKLIHYNQFLNWAVARMHTEPENPS